MTVMDLCQRFGISRNTIRSWRARYPTFPPVEGRTFAARYTQAHIEWIEAHLALRHNSVSTRDADTFCAEAGLTLPQYLRQRETSIRDFGIGVA